jgi:hypothetical protein
MSPSVTHSHRLPRQGGTKTGTTRLPVSSNPRAAGTLESSLSRQTRARYASTQEDVMSLIVLL